MLSLGYISTFFPYTVPSTRIPYLTALSSYIYKLTIQNSFTSNEKHTTDMHLLILYWTTCFASNTAYNEDDELISSIIS